MAVRIQKELGRLVEDLGRSLGEAERARERLEEARERHGFALDRQILLSDLERAAGRAEAQVGELRRGVEALAEESTRARG